MMGRLWRKRDGQKDDIARAEERSEKAAADLAKLIAEFEAAFKIKPPQNETTNDTN